MNMNEKGGRFQRAKRRVAAVGLPQRRPRRAPVPLHGQTARTASFSAQNYHALRLRSEIRPQRLGGDRC